MGEVKDVHKLKKLKSQLGEALGIAEAIKIEVANKQREYAQKMKVVEQLQSEIQSINEKKDLKVSEHAMLRYFERVKGYDLEVIEQEILSDRVKGMIDVLGGNWEYPNEGYKVVLKNYTVVTIK